MHILLVFLLLFQISYSYKPPPTPWSCTDRDISESNNENLRNLPSCSPGYAIDVEDVVYESTSDGICSGNTLCTIHHKNTLTFACNRKQTCNIEPHLLRFHINSTCGSTARFFTIFRCLPVIHEQKDYVCDSLMRRTTSSDINLSCERNYRLHITLALVGISVRQQSDTKNTRMKCNKDTHWLCNFYVPDAYRNVCNNQLSRGSGDQCTIRSNERPRLKGCPYGEASNFSLVEYSCIPGDAINEDLPRIDICSNSADDYILETHGLLHSPNYPYPSGKYLSCKRRLYVTRESRIRLFMLEKSIDYYHEFNIRLLNNEKNTQRTLARNELFDTNIKSQQKDEIVEIELKTNHFGGGNFLLYFQVDSRISPYAPIDLQAKKIGNDNQQAKIYLKRDWKIAIGSLVAILCMLLLITAIIIGFRIFKRRRVKSNKYLQTDDDHRQRLNASESTNDHRRPKIALQIEHPHLSPNTLTTNQNRSHLIHDYSSDRETLIKPPNRTPATSTNTDNFYDEIKEHEQDNYLDSGNNNENNPYIDSKLSDERKTFLDTKTSSKPIRDHRENERHYRPAPLAIPENSKRRFDTRDHEAPMASTETLNTAASLPNSERLRRQPQAGQQVAPPRMDLYPPQPSAPPLYLAFENNAPNNSPYYPFNRNNYNSNA